MSNLLFTFRPLTPRDLPLLAEWLARPHVAEWWGPFQGAEAVAEEYAADLASSVIWPHIAELDAAPFGFIQGYDVMNADPDWWQDETDPGARGIDQFVADADNLGKGLGTRMIAAFVGKLFADRAVTKIQTDPDPANQRAIRSYEKVGFRPVRELVTPDGASLLLVLERAAWLPELAP